MCLSAFKKIVVVECDFFDHFSLQALDHALARKAHIYAELAGYGSSSDAHHLTAPPASGHGAFRAMRLALRHAGLPPSAVSYINAHATSTKLGDVAESRAIANLMLGEPGGGSGGGMLLSGEGMKHAQEINASSTKGAVGHLLGGAGSVEAVWSVLAMRDVSTSTLSVISPQCALTDTMTQGILPPTLNLEHLDEQNKLVDFNYVPLRAQELDGVNVVLTNSFGFGGTNASLCFTKYKYSQ